MAIDLKEHVASIKDFPNKGVILRDTTPILQNEKLYRTATHESAEYAKSHGAEAIVDPKARGFIASCPVATELRIGFVPAHKPHRLSHEVKSASYGLEYDSNVLEMRRDAIKPGQKAVICGDLMTTADILRAAKELTENLGGEVVGAAFYIEPTDLKGREQFPDLGIHGLVKYRGA